MMMTSREMGFGGVKIVAKNLHLHASHHACLCLYTFILTEAISLYFSQISQ